jgi:hypothetical protein
MSWILRKSRVSFAAWLAILSTAGGGIVACTGGPAASPQDAAASGVSESAVDASIPEVGSL